MVRDKGTVFGKTSEKQEILDPVKPLYHKEKKMFFSFLFDYIVHDNFPGKDR